MENPELELARRFVERTATSVFLTGKAGTGKTTFLRELRARSPKRMIVLAPTGVAAINAGGVTIHSFFQLAFAPYVPESERGIAPDRPREAVRFSRQKIAIIKSIDLLVIDEISMVRADVLDAVNDVLRRFRDRRKPFTLTGMERTILQYYMDGYTVKDIPELAHISASTVKTHNRNLYRKMEVDSFDELKVYIELFASCGRSGELLKR